MSSSTAPPQARNLVPTEPDKVMVIRRLAPSLLVCSTPFKRFGRVKIGGRGTVVKLADSSLAVFSPVALTDIVKQQLQEQLGSTDVQYITALDQEHHIFLESWHKAWPHAKIIAPETLPGYRDKQNYAKLPDENWKLIKKADKTSTGVSVDERFDKEFDIEYVDAHGSKELVFNHRPSRTLIEADFFFNLPANEQMSRTDESPTSGLLTRLVVALSGTQGSAIWQKRFLWYVISNQAGDRAGFNQSVSRIVKWDFDRIVPCHGDVIESGGKGIFEKVMEWHLKAAEQRKGK